LPAMSTISVSTWPKKRRRGEAILTIAPPSATHGRTSRLGVT
jgi:hypothetical protein